MKRVLLTLVIAVVTATAFPVLLLGGEMFYEEAQDTTLTIECSQPGVLIAGFSMARNEGTGSWALYVDEIPLTGRDGYLGSSNATGSIILDPGIYIVHLKCLGPIIPLDECSVLKTWALFMGEEQQNCVSDGDYGAGHQPDYPPVSVSERVCRVGDHIDVYSPEPVIYDASGRLLERPVSFWIPTTPGIYFLSDETLQKVVVVE